MQNRFKDNKSKLTIIVGIYKPPGYKHFDSEIKHMKLIKKINLTKYHLI